MSDADRREEAVFEAALQLRATERAAYLEQACAGDARLRQRVESLLGALERAGGLLNEPAVARSEATVVLPLSPTAKPGDRIGRYKLLQQIGEGGCGVVYMAEQEEPVRRKVALKVIKLGMDTREVVARFEAERQALALMDHPNIAKILDGGVVGGERSEVRGERYEEDPGHPSPLAPHPSNLSGRPYFVMELVRGIRITDFCDQNHLGLQERLELFMQVCHAVQHAHQKGIIHRDLKPSNILVTINDGVPVPKVIDFGIAKATQQKLTEKTLFTAFGQFLGTPAYMSPEQTVMTSLDIDTRSDIYSLGVLLYELLTGKPPFDTQALMKAGLDELCRTLREVEPPRPSTRITHDLVAADVRRRTDTGPEASASSRRRLQEWRERIHLIRGDLDWIVMKCLEKDRARRYETASGLAADLLRHLSNEPVTARAPSAGYRFGKFARRNKVALAVVATIAAVLVLATGVSLWQARLARTAEAAAVVAKQETEAKAKAERAARKESEDITKFLTGIFRSPDPTRDGRTITVAETLDTAVKKLDLDLVAQPARRAQLQSTLGHTYRDLGLNREAIPLLERVRDYYHATSGPKHLDTLAAMHNLAMSYDAAGRLDEALKIQEEVLAYYRNVLGPKHPATLEAMSAVANSYAAGNRRGDALKLHEEVLALMREVLGPENRSTLLAMNNLAVSYNYAGRRDEALRLREEVLALQRKVNGPEHPDTLMAMNNLAHSYNDVGRRGEGLKMREEVLVLHRKVRGPEHPSTLVALINLARSYSSAGRGDEAIKMEEEALDLLRKVNGPKHPNTLLVMNNLTRSYSRAGRRDEAIKLGEEVLGLMRSVNGPEHPHTIAAMSNVAVAYADTGRGDEARKIWEEVLALRRKVSGPEHPDTLTAMNYLATSYLAAGRQDEELKLREELLASARKSGTNNSAELESRLLDLARVHYRLRQYGPAALLYREQIQSRRSRPGAERSVTVVSTTASLGRVLSEWAWAERGTNGSAACERAREGETILREALAGYERFADTAEWRIADVQSRIGGALVVIAFTDPALAPATRGPKLAEAEAILQQSRAGVEQDPRTEGQYRRDALERLARLYEAWNEFAPGTGQAAKAAEWKQKLAEFEQGKIGK